MAKFVERESLIAVMPQKQKPYFVGMLTEKEPNQPVEEFIRRSLEIFDGNFMIDEDVEMRAAFKKHLEVLAFLEKAYGIDGDKETVDICLEAIWKDLIERGEI